MRVGLEIGRTHPAHATSGGKLLLAQLTSEQVCALYPEEDLPAVTGRATDSRSDLLGELEAVRTRGYAVSHGESVDGMNAVAVLLAGTSRRDRVALMASTPADRGNDAALAHRAEELQQSAALLTGPPHHM